MEFINEYRKFTKFPNLELVSENIRNVFRTTLTACISNLKSKLKNRINLQNDFYAMSVDDKYALISDLIKSTSNDHTTSKFAMFFKNDDDISERYKKLLDALV